MEETVKAIVAVGKVFCPTKDSLSPGINFLLSSAGPKFLFDDERHTSYGIQDASAVRGKSCTSCAHCCRDCVSGVFRKRGMCRYPHVWKNWICSSDKK